MRTVRHDQEIGIPELLGIHRRRPLREFASERACEAFEAFQQRAGIDRRKCHAAGLELLIAGSDRNLLEADEVSIEDRVRLGILEPPVRLEWIADQGCGDAGLRHRGLDEPNHMGAIFSLESNPQIEARGIDADTGDPHMNVRTVCLERNEPVAPPSLLCQAGLP